MSQNSNNNIFTYGNLSFISNGSRESEYNKLADDISSGKSRFLQSESIVVASKSQNGNNDSGQPQDDQNQRINRQDDISCSNNKRSFATVWRSSENRLHKQSAVAKTFRLAASSQEIAGVENLLGIVRDPSHALNKSTQESDESSQQEFLNIEHRESNSQELMDTSADLLNNQNVHIFERGPWISLRQKYKWVHPLSTQYNIASILASKLGNGTKVPLLAVVVSKIIPLDDGAMAILADPSGEIQSEVVPAVIKSETYEFTEGAALLLENFTVYRSHLNREGYASHSIIITSRNVKRVFPASTPLQLDESLSGSDPEELVLEDWMDKNRHDHSVSQNALPQPSRNISSTSSLSSFSDDSDEELPYASRNTAIPDSSQEKTRVVLEDASQICSQTSSIYPMKNTQGNSSAFEDDKWLDSDEDELF